MAESSMTSVETLSDDVCVALQMEALAKQQSEFSLPFQDEKHTLDLNFYPIGLDVHRDTYLESFKEAHFRETNPEQRNGDDLFSVYIGPSSYTLQPGMFVSFKMKGTAEKINGAIIKLDYEDGTGAFAQLQRMYSYEDLLKKYHRSMLIHRHPECRQRNLNFYDLDQALPSREWDVFRGTLLAWGAAICFAHELDQTETVQMVVMSDEVVQVPLNSTEPSETAARPLSANVLCVENASPSTRSLVWPGKEVSALMIDTKTMAYTHILCAKDMTLHKIALNAEFFKDHVLWKEHFAYITAQPCLEGSLLQILRSHVFSALSRMGKAAAQGVRKQSRLKISCPFGFYAYMSYLIRINCGDATATLHFFSSRRAWKLECDDPSALDWLFGPAWNTVFRPGSGGYTSVRGGVDLSYSHLKPNVLHLTLHRITRGVQGGLELEYGN